MTLAEAASYLGYADYSPLRRAAKAKALRTERVANVYVTTKEWVDEWAGRRKPVGWPKGRPRGPRRPASEEQP